MIIGGSGRDTLISMNQSVCGYGYDLKQCMRNKCIHIEQYTYGSDSESLPLMIPLTFAKGDLIRIASAIIFYRE